MEPDWLVRSGAKTLKDEIAHLVCKIEGDIRLTSENQEILSSICGIIDRTLDLTLCQHSALRKDASRKGTEMSNSAISSTSVVPFLAKTCPPQNDGDHLVHTSTTEPILKFAISSRDSVTDLCERANLPLENLMFNICTTLNSDVNNLDKCYATGCVDLSNHVEVQQMFKQACQPGVPCESTKAALQCDWLLHHETVYFRFRPIKLESINQVYGLFLDVNLLPCAVPFSRLRKPAAQYESIFCSLPPLKFIFKLANIAIRDNYEALERFRLFTQDQLFSISGLKGYEKIPEPTAMHIHECLLCDMTFKENIIRPPMVSKFTLTEVMTMSESCSNIKLTRNQLFRRSLQYHQVHINDVTPDETPSQIEGMINETSSIWGEKDTDLAFSFQKMINDNSLEKFCQDTEKYYNTIGRIRTKDWLLEGQLVLAPFHNEGLYRGIITGIRYLDNKVSITHLDYYSSDTVDKCHIIPIEIDGKDDNIYAKSPWGIKVVILPESVSRDKFENYFANQKHDEQQFDPLPQWVSLVSHFHGIVYIGDIILDSNGEVVSTLTKPCEVPHSVNNHEDSLITAENIQSLDIEADSIKNEGTQDAVETLADDISVENDDILPRVYLTKNNSLPKHVPDLWKTNCQTYEEVKALMKEDTAVFEALKFYGPFLRVKSSANLGIKIAVKTLVQAPEIKQGAWITCDEHGVVDFLNIVERKLIYLEYIFSNNIHAFDDMVAAEFFLMQKNEKIFYPGSQYDKLNFPRTFLVNPLTKFKPDPEMLESAGETLPFIADILHIRKWILEDDSKNETFFYASDFQDEFESLDTNFTIFNMNVKPHTPECINVSIQDALAMDSVYISEEFNSEEVFQQYSQMFGSDFHLKSFWPTECLYDKSTARASFQTGHVPLSDIPVVDYLSLGKHYAIFGIRVDGGQSNIGEELLSVELVTDRYIHGGKFVLFKSKENIKRGCILSLYKSAQVMDIDCGLIFDVPLTEVYIYPDGIKRTTSTIICQLEDEFCSAFDFQKMFNPSKSSSFEVKFKIIGHNATTNLYLVDLICCDQPPNQAQLISCCLKDYGCVFNSKKVNELDIFEIQKGKLDVIESNIECDLIEKASEIESTSGCESVASKTLVKEKNISSAMSVCDFQIKKDSEGVYLKILWKPKQKDKYLPVELKQLQNLKFYEFVKDEKYLCAFDVDELQTTKKQLAYPLSGIYYRVTYGGKFGNKVKLNFTDFVKKDYILVSNAEMHLLRAVKDEIPNFESVSRFFRDSDICVYAKKKRYLKKLEYFQLKYLNQDKKISLRAELSEETCSIIPGRITLKVNGFQTKLPHFLKKKNTN